MIEACPNLNDPVVARAFNELKEATSEKTAYNIWSLNNGYGIDKAPNGAESVLFNSLLIECNGDRRAAIRAKAALYGNRFREWFGDWLQEDKTNVSKVVDENGEPLVVYHGTLSEFSVFDFNRLGETTGQGYYTDHITGEKIPIDSSYAFFFTDNKYGARSYKNLAVWHQNTFRAQVYRNLFAIFGNSKFDYVQFEGKEKQAQRDFINNIVSPYLGFDVLREANKIISGESALTKEQRSLYAEKFQKIENKIENLPDARQVSNLANNLQHYKDDLRFIQEHKQDLIDGIPIQRLADSIIRISTGYGSWEKGDVSLTIYNENENGYSVLGLTKKNGDFKKITADNFDELVNEFKRGILLVEEELKQYERAGHYDTNGNVISVFLNIKNPLEHDYNNSPFPDAYLINAKEDDPDASNYDASGVLKKPLKIKGKRVPTAYVAARQVKKARNDGNDGVVYKNVQDPFKMTSYGIFGANQVKSAVSNREIEQPGTGFSTTDDNIYNHLHGKKINTVEDAKEVLTSILELYYDFHNWRGERITKNKQDQKSYTDQIQFVLNQFGLPSKTIYINDGGFVEFDDKLLSENIDAFKDRINTHGNLRGIAKIGKLFSSLQSKFPNIKGIRFAVLKGANAKFENGYVYIDPNNVTSDTLVEECLHPFVDALYHENPELFNNLLKEARKEFPKLRAEIAKSYSPKKFTPEDRYKELVTQALSRHYAEIYRNDIKQESSIWKKALDWILNVLGISGAKGLDKNLTLGQLADALYKAEHVEVDQSYYGSTSFNLNQSYEDTAAEFLASSPAIQTAFNVQRENYIRSHNPQTEDERNQLAREFDLTQMKQNTERVTEAIAKEYGLSILPAVVVSGPFRQAFPTYTANDEKGKYVAMLLNSMNKRLSDPNFASTEARFLLDTVIGTNDISQIIMQMARVYIEDFYEADAIQEVMAMVDPTGKMHKDDLIDTLTDMVTKAVIDPKSTEVGTVVKINNTILNFVRKRFNQNTISEQAKRMLIGVIAENMSCYEDLQRVNTEDLLHDVKWYEITGKESQVTPKNIVDAIKKGVKIQIKSQQSVTNVDSEKLLILNQMLAKLEAIDFDNNPDDVLGVVSDFIVDGMQDINKANATLHSMLAIDPANIDSKQLYSIRTDVIGYYRSIINNYIIPFTRNTTNQTLQPGGALYSTIRNILDKCTHTQQLYDYVLRVYVEKLIDNFVDSNVNIGDKERFKVNCKLWLHNKVNNGDLGFFENWIKSAVSSHSPIVRMVDDFVREYETDVRKQALKKAKQLQNTYRKCEPSLAKLSPFNYQRNFCELDDDGQTTGNFISEVNVGQFDKEKKQFIDWWIENCGVTRNEDGVLEFPDDETWKEFNDAYDDFLDGRQHRRYTAGYYKLERQFLSRDTIEYRRNIRKRIQLLYDKCYDKDIDGPNIWSLNREDYQSLQDLLKLQQNLANPYIITYDTDGKISKIEEKVGDAARMAREISEFNKVISGNIKFTPNYDKYNSAKKAIEQKFGKNSNEYKAFVYNFSTRAVKQKYYERLEQIFGPKSSLIFPALDRINNKIKAIINATISKRGKYVQDLSKMSDAAYAELKKLEEEKINLLRTLKTKSGKKLTQEEWDEINGMHHYEYVVNPATGIPVIKELEQEYDQKGKHQEFLNKFFVISNDSAHPLSIFLYDRIEPEYIDEEQPIGMFSDVDESSYYIDSLYDPEDKEFMNVDKKRYHNDKFDELKKDSNAYKFYTEMLKMMDEAWSMLPDINRHYKYMLPQRRGSISQLVARDIVNTFTGKQGRQKISFKQVSKNIIKLVIAGMLGGLALGGLAALSPWITTSAALITGAGYGTITGFIAGLLTRDKNISDQLLSITENDVQFNESFAVRPDGTEVETIPIRFVRRLDDPTSVSTDLINSVSTFYEMALNYKQKEKLAPIVENIQFELSGGFNGSSITDQADRVRSYKSAMIYGRKKTGLARRSSNKMTQSEQKISKLVSFILNTTHAKMLPWNGTSIYKNMIDSTLSLISLLTSMKQLTPQDLGYGIIDMGKEIFNDTAFTNIGSPNTSSFTGAAMQYNGVHMNIGGTFGDTQKYWVRRCFERFMSMGPFTLIDYTFKGLFTNMVYNTYRLVLNPSTGKMEFMNKQEAQFAYAGENGGRKEGLKRWKKATTKLRDAYVVTEDGLQLKDEYKELVSKKLETRVSGLIREQSAVVNGMLDEQDINKVSQNFIGSMILLMRGWMVSQLIDYNKDGQDFAVFATNTEDINTKLFGSNNLGSLQSKFIGSLDAFVSQQAPTDQEGQYNFATGFIERGWWVGWNKLVKNALSIRRLTPHNKYQLRYLAMILLTTISLGLATHPLYKWREEADAKYKETDPYNVERVASNFLYTGTVAAYSERFGQIGPFGFANSLLELVNSPTVASSYIKDLNSIIDVSEDIFKLTDELWHGYGIDQTEPMQIVKRSSFKGRTKLTKDLLKASTEMPVINELGIANIYKTISPDAQKEKLKFYKKTIPFTGIQPWLKLPETGQQKTTTSKAAKPVKKYR